MTDTADRIELRGLRVLAFCGALPEEQGRRQPIEVDVDVALALGPAGRSDELTDTVDYGGLCVAVERLVAAQHFQLLERLAECIADTALGDERVEVVTVAVRKLRPPVPSELATAGVRIVRGRASGGPGSG